MNYTFTYSLTETENLIFTGSASNFQIYSKAESSSKELIARFITGKWSFDNLQQRQLFMLLFDNNRIEFYKAYKAYMRSFKDKPKLYEFTCIRRKFSIRVTKLKQNIQKKIFGLHK